MTVKEFYEEALKHGALDSEIEFNDYCDDDYYSRRGIPLYERDISYRNGVVSIDV